MTIDPIDEINTLPTELRPLSEPELFARDSNGLLKGVTYPYNADHSVNWRRLIPHEFLAIKDQYVDSITKKHGKPASEVDRSLIPDNQLLILLGGTKKLLFLRGYTSLKQCVDYISPEKAVCTCTITFIGNYETGMQPVTYTSVASASYINTSGNIAQIFLETTAENRALVRCVRGFLNINIVGSDEMGPTNLVSPVKISTPNDEAVVPSASGFKGLDTLMKSGLTIEQIKKGAAGYRKELKGNPDEWKSFQDIDPLDRYILIGKLTEKKATTVAAKGK